MKVLVIGGSGYVAGLTLPYLRKTHDLRIFDLKPPTLPELQDVPYIPGDAGRDFNLLTQALAGMDALLYMAMGNENWQDGSAIITAFDSNVKAVYLALEAAGKAGVPHAVYTSSMSVYEGDLYRRYFPDEGITPDSTHFYGLTKRLGEEICQNACRAHGLTVNALRLCLPVPEAKWLAEVNPGVPTIMTTAHDVARALLAALSYRGGFEAFMISGDYEQKLMNMAKARRLLGWEPLARPVSCELLIDG